ncbi:S9 family peptidase [Roseivirga sp.]|uniref:S9 family peptidase n=1 Tax=Roseivirga sp. TaxID=1964215 RepID=UPI003B8E154F
MRKQFLTFLALILFASLSIAQEKKPMSWKDIPTWKYMQGNSFRVSPDGQWVAYGIVAAEADGEIILKKISDPDSLAKSFPIGSTTFPSIQFSDDSKWIAFKEYPKFSARKANKGPRSKPLRDKLTLLELGTDEKKTFENVISYSFNNEKASQLAINLAKDGNSKARGSDLLIHHLTADKSQNIGNVTEFRFNKSGSHLAYVVDAANKTGNGLYLMDMAGNSTQILDSDNASYKFINWTEKGDAFAALKMVEDKKFKQPHGKVVGVKNLKSPQITLYDAAKDSTGFDQSHTISGNRRPMWSEDLTRLFYGIHPLELVKKPSPKKELDKDSMKVAQAKAVEKIMADTSLKSITDLQKAIAKVNGKKAAPKKKNDADKPDMSIWHWNDSRLQSQQQSEERRDKNYSMWAMYDVASAKHIALQDDSMNGLSIFPKHLYALGSDNQNYELDINLDGQRYNDLYLVDLKTGTRKELFTKFYLPSFWSNPSPSTDGTKFIYAEDGHYFVHDIVNGNTTNITENLPVTFVNVEDDHNVEKPMVGFLGWSSDSKYILLRDGWDIWQVPLAGKIKPVNLTENGRKEGIRYQYRFGLDPEEKGIDLSKTIYLRTYGEWTKKSGVATLSPTKKSGLKPGVTSLIWDDANVGGLRKAEDADVFFFSKQTFNTPPEMFVTDKSLSSPKQVTKNTPDADKYAWSEGTQLVDYVTDKGDSLQGALFLPANYVKGEKYPTVVYYYEKLSQTRHNWSNPSFSGTGWNPNMYTSNGYAVFIPDIVYKLDDPGMSAVWAVLPAVKAAIATGVVDADNIGIHGHSWGGYQTAFLITQTNMFKAAAAGAPLTNMVSMYDLIYWNGGIGNMAIFESSQGRFRGAPWENWDSYLRNSPVYHVKKVNTPLLMLHNDKDGAVDFTQGIEYYSALRRLKKPVVLVQYKGENHGLSKMENRKDYSVRMMEFFDHHLKGLKAPDWLDKGIDKLDLKEHLEKRSF